MFLYFHFSLCDVWVDSKGTMLADRLTKIEDAADAFGNHVICSSKAAVAAAVAVAALFEKNPYDFFRRRCSRSRMQNKPLMTWIHWRLRPVPLLQSVAKSKYL